jgi:pyruvate, orthophosphate dikinase
MTAWVYGFDDADPEAVELLGGKGAGLVRLSRAGLPVPPGFIVSTRACAHYVATGEFPAAATEEVRGQVAALEQATERSFGAGPLPLLVSVRSGAPVSMPGMMETILNLGIGRDAAVALAETTGDSEFVLDVTRRLQRAFSEGVFGGDPDVIDEAVADFALTADGPAFGETFDIYWALCRQALEGDVGAAVPDDPWEQLQTAIVAVLRSWSSHRAFTYREHQEIPHDMGTAVVVQSMVFGNLGSPSGTGVAFTRNPMTGERDLYGEFLERGQGEDLVAGVADPETIAQAARRSPQVFGELARICEDLELAYGDALDIEYTVESGKLYVLQVRSAMRTPEAAIKIAADTLREGHIDPSAAVAGVSADHLRWVERPKFDRGDLERARAEGAVLAAGIGASPGQVSGRLVLDSDRAVEWANEGKELILARPTTSPQDLHGLIAAAGIVTSRGGATSHAAVVARALAKPCVVGCSAVSIDEERRTLTAGRRVLEEGDPVSIDGSAGELLVGRLSVDRAVASSEDLTLVMDRLDAASGCAVFAHAPTPMQAKQAGERGATGAFVGVDEVLALSVPQTQEAVAEAFTPLMAALDAIDIDVAAGDPNLVRAQIGGLALAAERSGYGATPRLVVGDVGDPREARDIRRLGEQLSEGRRVGIGVYLTSPQAVLSAGELAEESEVVWVDARAVEAATSGVPAGHNVGIRLAGRVSDEVAARLYNLGFRLFAVDLDELRVARLALGKAALK